MNERQQRIAQNLIDAYSLGQSNPGIANVFLAQAAITAVLELADAVRSVGEAFNAKEDL